jgi:hypothetical protein
VSKTRLLRYNKRILDTQTFTNSPAGPNEQTTPRVRTSEVLMAWSAPSHHNHDRSKRWYVISGVLVLVIAAYGILSGNWSVTLVSLLLGGTYFLTRRETTALKTIRIETDGVQFEETFTPWSQCKDFWIITTPIYTELHIVRKGTLKSDIRIQTSDIDPIVIRSTLSQFLTMRPDQREHLFDVIIRLCKL